MPTTSNLLPPGPSDDAQGLEQQFAELIGTAAFPPPDPTQFSLTVARLLPWGSFLYIPIGGKPANDPAYVVCDNHLFLPVFPALQGYLPELMFMKDAASKDSALWKISDVFKQALPKVAGLLILNPDGHTGRITITYGDLLTTHLEMEWTQQNRPFPLFQSGYPLLEGVSEGSKVVFGRPCQALISEPLRKAFKDELRRFNISPAQVTAFLAQSNATEEAGLAFHIPASMEPFQRDQLTARLQWLMPNQLVTKLSDISGLPETAYLELT